MRRLMCTILSLAATVTAAQARTVTNLLVSVITHPIVGATAPMPRVVFDDEPVIIEADLSIVSIPDEVPSASKASVAIQLPRAEWWRSLHWSLRDAHQGEQPLPIDAARVVREDPGAAARAQSADREHRITLRTGERASVVLNVGSLPRGDYTLTAELGELSSAPYVFAVRNGSESPEIHRAYLHDLMRRPQSYDRSREIILQLASVEPQNASLFEDLGDLAVRNDHPREADYAYRQAAAIIEENRLRLRRSNQSNAILEKEFDRKLEQIASVR